MVGKFVGVACEEEKRKGRKRERRKRERDKKGHNRQRGKREIKEERT